MSLDSVPPIRATTRSALADYRVLLKSVPLLVLRTSGSVLPPYVTTTLADPIDALERLELLEDEGEFEPEDEYAALPSVTLTGSTGASTSIQSRCTLPEACVLLGCFDLDELDVFDILTMVCAATVVEPMMRLLREMNEDLTR